MKKTPKKNVGKKASEVVANCDFKKLIYDEVYLLGASVKDMGVGLCAITYRDDNIKAIKRHRFFHAINV